MYSNKSQRVFIIIMVLMICLLSACATNQRPGPTTPNTPDNQAPQTQPNQQTNNDMGRSQEIARKVEQEVKEINSATVVISGNQAWIGVDAKANAEITDQVKERISNLVKEEGQGIQTVYVTADADSVTRLRNIANDIAAGKPISGFLNELAEIASRITPTPR